MSNLLPIYTIASISSKFTINNIICFHLLIIHQAFVSNSNQTFKFLSFDTFCSSKFQVSLEVLDFRHYKIFMNEL